MDRKKVFSIITIISFASIIFIPIGLVLMFYFTDWKKKAKVITATVMTALYIGIILLIMNLQPAANTSGISLPGSYDKGSTEFATETKPTKAKIDPTKEMELVEGVGAQEIENPEDLENMELPSTIKKQARKKNSSWVYPLIFFLIMLTLIIIQNIRSSKKADGYDNPYVDVKKYKLPLEGDVKFPMVHFLKLELHPDEQYLYATETTQKDNEGNFVITNERVVIYNKEGIKNYKLEELTLASSVSNNVMLITAGEEKNFIFLPDNQMKYALAVVRYAYNNYGPGKAD